MSTYEIMRARVRLYLEAGMGYNQALRRAQQEPDTTPLPQPATTKGGDR